MSNTPARLAAIRERLTQATPGPWTFHAKGDVQVSADGMPVVVNWPYEGGGLEERAKDGPFIAHAPDDIAFLLDALTAAQADAGRLERFLPFAKLGAQLLHEIWNSDDFADLRDHAASYGLLDEAHAITDNAIATRFELLAEEDEDDTAQRAPRHDTEGG